jgi:3-deoxy-D-manno-octulosonic-acid transferase
LTILYHTSLHLYLFASAIAGIFSRKAAKFYNGRKDLLKKIESKMAQLYASKGNTKDLLWIHCASVGEFEQARPVIEKHKATFPDVPVILTFFSPSGYELRKNYSFADAVFYLPMDTRGNAATFLDLVKPTKVIFVKYEFWRNYLGELKRRAIPVYLISAIFREEQHFFKFWGGYFRKILKNFDHIFVQDDNSEMLLKMIGVENVTVCGDTRFDRVREVTGTDTQIEPLAEFSQNSLCLVAGSTWPADEEILARFFKAEKGRYDKSTKLPFKLVIAPHEVDDSHISKLMSLFEEFKVVRYSDVKKATAAIEADVFIIDTIGILSVAYRYGSVAYIGGGFGVGIHNILEAAAYGIPVIFGPKYQKFKEAKDLIKEGGAYSIDSFEKFSDQVLQLTSKPELLNRRGEICKEYVERNLGATSAILASIYPHNSN